MPAAAEMILGTSQVPTAAGNVDVAEAGCGHHQVRWPLPQHLVGDPVPSQLGIPGLGLHRCLRASANDGILSPKDKEVQP